MAVKQYNTNCVRLLLQIALQGNESAIRQVCDDVHLSYLDLENPDCHIEPSVQERLWLRLTQQLDTTNLGLCLGQQLGTTWGGIVNLMAQVSSSLYVVLHGFGQHRELFTNPNYYQAFATVDRGELTYIDITFLDMYAICYPYYCRHTVEGMFVVTLQILQTFSKQPITPVKIDWQHAQPSSLERHQAIFQSPMQFDTGANRLYFRRCDLNRPIVTHNPELYDHLNQIVERSCVGKSSYTWSDRVGAHIRQCLVNQQTIVIEEIADRLNVSIRSLQRKLEQEQTVFGQLVDGIRKELAFQLMGTRNYTIAEIAQLTGYEEPGSFRRAFKRWTGSSPKRFQLATNTFR
ncbi:AraC family transcriptional regulator [Spirosoma validum]|uniref:AraC family transcriptional regulator ligand-binding domain-containing protein n=1 Tax=Spirosoma validum TaxID=2771355 RepID=A0A927GGL2_9BACT|nr:AraC family transcriptional regulator [Spirosoma validum]MBD2756730.1 AraC family transcriptional regulator ligand-binding domain-containing protein [Spirosoma validum]